MEASAIALIGLGNSSRPYAPRGLRDASIWASFVQEVILYPPGPVLVLWKEPVPERLTKSAMIGMGVEEGAA